MNIPKFVRVIVEDAHDTTSGKTYKVNSELTSRCLERGAVWIEKDDVGDEYYLYANEFEVVACE